MKVLVVEDDVNGAETIRRRLRADGWAVDLADNGADGLHMAQNGGYDVVVLDIMLPELNGYQVIRALRDHRVWTPVLMLTAKDGDHDQADAFDLGADDYMIKPFSFVVLNARLRALLRRGSPERPAVLTAGDLSLDPAAHVVMRGEATIELTPKEFAVLEYLLRHKGTAVSKAQIMGSVWDINYHGDDNVVEVYVGYLRKRIDAPFGRKSIETLRGVGYRLRDDGG
jgi:two-component system OmpR family response regulator